MAGETILVVEDNPMNMELIIDILETQGYRVLKAITGAAALDSVRSAPPDLILMDIQLPGLDGLTVTGALKDDPETRDIPVIALTAHAMRGDEERARQAGCDDYISKPIDTRQLPIMVRTYLDRKSANPSQNGS